MLAALKTRALVPQWRGVQAQRKTEKSPTRIGADEFALMTEWAKKDRDQGWNETDVVLWYLNSKARYNTLGYGSMLGVKRILEEAQEEVSPAPGKGHIYKMSQNDHDSYKPDESQKPRKRQKGEPFYRLRSDDELAQARITVDFPPHHTKRKPGDKERVEVTWKPILKTSNG